MAILRHAIIAAMQHFGDKKVVGAEIGSSIGNNAYETLTAWENLEKLHMVDSFVVCPDFKSQEEQERNKFILTSRFEGDPRTNIILKSSDDACKMFEPKSLDFVYIDANHTYEAIKKDLINWTPLVKDGGMVSGHDYEYWDDEKQIRSVKIAVEEYFDKSKLRFGVRVRLVDLDTFAFSIECDWWIIV